MGVRWVLGRAWPLESDCLVPKLASPFWARYLTPLCLFIYNVRVKYGNHLTEMWND